jgi:hypothetical protein
VKKKADAINLELGENVKLHEIMDLEGSSIMGRFSSKRMNKETLKSWTKENFAQLLGYSQCNMVLVKGWLVWIINSREDAKKIIKAHWTWGSQALFLKK